MVDQIPVARTYSQQQYAAAIAIAAVAAFVVGCLATAVVEGAVRGSAAAPNPAVGTVSSAVSVAPAAPEADSFPVAVGKATTEGEYVTFPVTVKNLSGEQLSYLEVTCAFYAADGSLSATGLTNWTSVSVGETVSGEVSLDNVKQSDLAKYECHGRTNN